MGLELSRELKDIGSKKDNLKNSMVRGNYIAKMYKDKYDDHEEYINKLLKIYHESHKYDIIEETEFLGVKLSEIDKLLERYLVAYIRFKDNPITQQEYNKAREHITTLNGDVDIKIGELKKFILGK